MELASMGPHFFKCGKGKYEVTAEFAEVKLQWGRTFSSAESKPAKPSQLWRNLLQWGRTFSSAERNKIHLFRQARRLGFNGAALFQVRKERL